jgi:small GTP-binding protein
MVMQSTVGIDFNVRDLSRGGQVYRLQMWDTAGQERYRSLIPTYLKNAQCAVFVYDVTRPSTLEDVKIWQRLFREHQEAPGVLVANKTDLSAGRYADPHAGRSRARRDKQLLLCSSSNILRSQPRPANVYLSSSMRSWISCSNTCAKRRSLWSPRAKNSKT